MSSVAHEFPISISTGVFGLTHESEQVPRMGLMLNFIPKLQDKFSRSIGGEFNAVNTNWLEELWIMLATGMSGEIVRMADQGSIFSIHAPNNVPYNDFANGLTKRTVKAIHGIQDLIPIKHVVVHGDLVEPGSRVDLAKKIGRDILVYENSDSRPKGYPLRHAHDIESMAKDDLRVLIDVGHVCHAGPDVVEDFPMIIAYQKVIAAYHVSAVYGDDGMHYPLASIHGQDVLKLLDNHQSKMNGAVRVIESPIPVGKSPFNFLNKEIELLLNPNEGIVQ